jgi:hypothetical protein
MTTSIEDSMIHTIRDFRDAVHSLRTAPTPRSDRLPAPEGYETYSDQWLRWLEEYRTPGFYNRQTIVDDAKTCYNRLANAPAIIWLNEAAGMDDRVIEAAIVASRDRSPKQTAAMYARRVLLWSRVEPLLFGRRP